MESQEITILVADDHPVVRHGIASMISYTQNLRIVAEAPNGQEALSLYRKCKPDVALIDLSLPDMTGIEVISKIRSEHPSAKCIILSVYDGSEDIFQALQAGALSYLLKDTKPEEMVRAIHRVNSGERYIPTHVGDRLAERVADDILSERELQVLQMMARGMSNREIGDQIHLSEATVKSHAANIFDKLMVSSRTQAILEAMRRGMIRKT